MNDWDTFLAFFAVYTGIGIVLALPLFIPTVRRWIRAKRKRRVAVISIYTFTVFLIVSGILSFYSASIRAFSLCYDLSDIMDTGADKNLTDDMQQPSKHSAKVKFQSRICDPVQLGFVQWEEMMNAITNEMFRHYMMPPPFRKDCYLKKPEFCEFITSSSSSYEAYPSGYWWGLWPAIVTGLFLLWWTRPKKEEISGEEL